MLARLGCNVTTPPDWCCICSPGDETSEKDAKEYANEECDWGWNSSGGHRYLTRQYFSLLSPSKMQRRGKAQLRIASPGQSDPLMASDAQKTSRISRSSLTRVWLIIALAAILIVLSHFLFPPHNEPSSHPTYSNANLKAKNYLRSTDEPNPFDFCPAYNPGDDVGTKYGPIRLAQSRLHMGSGARILRMLNRALAGHPVTISVIGGSSTCQNCLFQQALTRYYSFFLPRRWRRPSIPNMLSIPLFPMVEHRLSSPRLGIDQWCYAADRLEIFFILQHTPPARPQ